MQVHLKNVGKRFNKQWIFRKLNLDIASQSSLIVLGANGSGKSTLIKLIGAYLEPTEGHIEYLNNQRKLINQSSLQKIALVAPYVNVVEEFSLKEHLTFHFKFKKATITIEEMARRSGLEFAWNKQVKDFSSGMKQRLKLCFAFFTDDELILLDEPNNNMDIKGIDWYQEEILNIIGKRTLIIASNQKNEHEIIMNPTYLDLDII